MARRFRVSTLVSALIGLCAVASVGCERKPSPEPTSPAAKTAEPPSPSPAGPAAEVEVRRVERKMMGTLWAVAIAGGDASAGRRAADKALDEVARLDGLLSEWQPDSEISRVNKAAGKAPVRVGRELLACVKASLEVARWSDGAFDISWASLRDLWDFSADAPGVPPSAEAIKQRLPLWNYRNIVLDEAASTVFLKRRGMQVGLGGVAKGYALDRAGEILRSAGFHDFMMYAGGQVLVHGRRGDRMWRVGIQHPREPRHFAYVEVTDASLATSGDYEHAFEFEGRHYHHIIDPATGYPSDKTASVTVIAETALWADAVDTAIFIMGPTRGIEAAKHAPGGPIDVAIVDPSMHLAANDGLKARLYMTAEIEPDGRIGRPLDRNAANGPRPLIDKPSLPAATHSRRSGPHVGE